MLIFKNLIPKRTTQPGVEMSEKKDVEERAISRVHLFFRVSLSKLEQLLQKLILITILTIMPLGVTGASLWSLIAPPLHPQVVESVELPGRLHPNLRAETQSPDFLDNVRYEGVVMPRWRSFP